MNHTLIKITNSGRHQLNLLKCAFAMSMLCEPALYAGPNLVPNPGFEDYTTCPYDVSQLNLAAPWFPATRGTPEYFNACNSGSFGVPENIFGNQAAHGGVAYAGEIAYGGTGFREYIETPLQNPLVAGHTYQVSFWVCLANSHCYSGYAVDNLGAYFSIGPVSDYTVSANYPNGFIGNLPYTPQVINPAGNFLSSTNTWMQIQGTFCSCGGEDHLTIGNFSDEQNTPTIPVSGFSPGCGYSYYYIDDVSVMDTGTCSSTCSNGCIVIPTPPNIVVTTCSNSAAVSFSVYVSDYCCSNCVTLVSDPPSGNNFALGTTTVTNTATDTLGNSNSCTFTVTVIQNTNPPVITYCPASIIICTTNGCGSMPDATSQVQAKNATGGDAIISQNIAPGTLLCSNTNVIVTATDACGDSTNRIVPCNLVDCSSNGCLFQVVCPTNMTVISCTNVPVFYQPTVTDTCCSNYTVVCNPTNGTWFAPGTTNNVLCLVTDTCSNSNSCPFTVTVIPCVASLAATWDHNYLNLNWSTSGPAPWLLQNSTDLVHWTFYNATNVIPPVVINPRDAPNIAVPAQYYRLFRTN